MAVVIAILAVALIAGLFGSMLGVGGGVIMVPMLSLAFGVPIKTAIATSIVCVIATSSMAQTTFVSRGMTNIRLGMLLEVATSIGQHLNGYKVVVTKSTVPIGTGKMIEEIVRTAMADGAAVGEVEMRNAEALNGRHFADVALDVAAGVQRQRIALAPDQLLRWGAVEARAGRH